MAGERLTAQEIMALARAGESQTVEFKLENEKQPDIGELLAALANADGGVVLFGVTDQGEIAGVRQPNTIEQRIVSAARSCRPPLNPYLTVYTVAVDGKMVVVGQLPALGEQVYSHAGVYRQRQSASNIALSGEEMKHLILSRLGQGFDSQALDVGLDALAPSRVDRLLQMRAEMAMQRGNNPAPVEPYPSPPSLRQLASMRAVVEVRGKYQPTVAGILMLGRDPQSLLPQAGVHAAAFNDEGATFLDRAEISGTIEEQLDNAMSFIARNTRLGAIIRGARRVERPDYPMVAVREAIVNALLHRNYTELAPISIYIFPSRIEVVSPGGLLPGLAPDDLEGKHVLRNHALGPLTYFAKIAESFGTGIWRMREAVREMGLPDLVIRAKGDWVRVIMYRRSATSKRPSPRPVAAEAEQGDGSALGDERQFSLNDRQRDLLRSWRRVGGGRISRAGYMARYNVSQPTAGRDLYDLEKRGLVQRAGSGAAITYFKRWLPSSVESGDEDKGTETLSRTVSSGAHHDRIMMRL